MREVAASLGIAESCLHRWKRLDLIDRGLKAPSPAAIESAALAKARARIAELENEVKILRKAAAAIEQAVPPKARFALVAELAVEGVPVKQACLALGVSRSGFYDARTRPPSARAIRQAWLTDQITAIHQASRQTYGSPRVRAELVHGQGVAVSRKTVTELMRRAGPAGLPLRRRAKRVPPAKTVTDLVKRDFRRDGPNQLWVTDITEHPTREDKLYRCVVLDAYSRRVVGMAIDARGIAGQIPGGIIHADHGTQFTSWTFTERAHRAGLLPSPGTVGDPYDNAVAEAFWGPHTDRTPRPAALEDPRRARERDFRVHRGVLQPTPTPFRPGLDEPATVRNHHPHVEPDLLTSESVKPGQHHPSAGTECRRSR